MDAVAILHDRDGADAHGHVYIYDRKTPRTEAQIRRLFPVDVIVQPYTVIPDGEDAGVHEGRELARAARYLTHEHPSQAHKARYEDSEVLASRGYDWRSDVDALSSREGLVGAPERVSLTQLLGDVARGLRTPRQVAEQHAELYVRRPVSAWDTLAQQAAQWAAEDAREAARQVEQEAAAAHAPQAEQESRQAAEEARQQEEQDRQQQARAAADALKHARLRWANEGCHESYEAERRRLRAVVVVADTLDLDLSSEDLDTLTAQATAEGEGRAWDGAPLDLAAAVRAVDLIYLDGTGSGTTWDDVAEDVADGVKDLEETASAMRAGSARNAALDVSPVGPNTARDRLVRDMKTAQAGGQVKGSAQYVKLVATIVREQDRASQARSAIEWLRVQLERVDRAETEAVRSWAGLA
ncbi:hypothetical protein ACHMXD_02775 [Micrococcus luteus]